MGARTPQKWGDVLPKSGEANKEQEHKNSKTNSKPSLALSSEVDGIYDAYPRKKKPADAKKAIRKALTRLLKVGVDGSEPFADERAAAAYLLKRTEFYAKSPDGNRGKYTPYPASWFNAESYLENESEWSSNGTPEPTKTELRTTKNRANLLDGFGIAAPPGPSLTDDREGTVTSRGQILEGGTPRLLGKGD
jgi:hypothetical protein